MVTTTLYGKSTETCGELIDYNLTLEYYIVTEPLCAQYTDLLRYGVKIKKIAEFSDGTSDEEAQEIRDIFYRPQDADKFMRLLMKNKVTPTHLREIVEEYISDSLKISN